MEKDKLNEKEIIDFEEKIKTAKWALNEAEEEINTLNAKIKEIEKENNEYTKKLQNQKKMLKKFLLRNKLWVKFLEFQFELIDNWPNYVNDDNCYGDDCYVYVYV